VSAESWREGLAVASLVLAALALVTSNVRDLRDGVKTLVVSLWLGASVALAVLELAT